MTLFHRVTDLSYRTDKAAAYADRQRVVHPVAVKQYLVVQVAVVPDAVVGPPAVEQEARHLLAVAVQVVAEALPAPDGED